MGMRGKKILAAALAVTLAAGSWAWARAQLPSTFVTEAEMGLSFAGTPWLQPLRGLGTAQASAAAGQQSVWLSWRGVLPLRNVQVVTAQRPRVWVSGQPFGIKMFSDGALVVAFTDIRTALGSENPAKAAGLRLGDLIVRMNNTAVHNNEEVAAAIRAAGGQEIEVQYVRGSEKMRTTLVPVCQADGKYMVGMWVRDSSAGIGTLTFTEPEKHIFAGLGHAISDADTGEAVTLLSGEIVPVKVTGFTRGSAGVPGELQGEFAGSALGRIAENDFSGVYGTLQAQAEGKEMPVAFCQEVKKGTAWIMTTIEGDTPELYQAEIEYISLSGGAQKRNMLVRITDENLLRATGGIIQGMSGSPILQEGRLVGAITHVLVNDPTRGYGIFAHTMLQEAETIA